MFYAPYHIDRKSKNYQWKNLQSIITFELIKKIYNFKTLKHYRFIMSKPLKDKVEPANEILKKESLKFLSGGGQMGELIRSFEWSKTSVGNPDAWPQSLRLAVRIMLDSPFGMYIAWGKEYIQIYNDGYRPILGDTKHPHALGISTTKTFAEIWSTIGPMFDGVMAGKAVGFPDFVLLLDRNGYLEECVFDFSYSPIRFENGEVGGVLVTVIETTEKIKAVKALKKSEEELQFAIEATELATWDLNPFTNKFRGNHRLKEWFGLKPNDEIELPLTLEIISDKDKDRVTAAIQTALQYSLGGLYDITYTIIHPQTKFERIVRAKGRSSFDDKGIACQFSGTLQDITEEIVARRLLTESEAKFRTLSDTIPHLVWTATPDGKKNFFNQYFLEYTGLSFEVLKGEGWHKIIFPDDLEKELLLWHHHIKTGKDFKIEKRVRHNSGTYRWHLSHCIAQKDAGGKITAWIGTNTDITEQKSFAERLEIKVKERTEQLQLQNQTFELAESIAKFGTYKWNMTTGLLEYSDNLFRLLDCEPQEFVPSFEKFLSFIHPDDLQQVNENGEQTILTGHLVETPYRIISKTGTIKYFRSSGSFSGEGSNRLLIGTVQDISKDVLAAEALVENENYLNQIISNAPDAVIVINEKGNITLWNPKTVEIFGWTAEEVLGLDLTDTIIPTQYRENHKVGVKRIVKTGEARILNKTLEITALNKAGKEFPISLTISQATQRGNKLFIAFLRDITFEKRTIELDIINQALLKANTELEASQKLSEKFLKQKDEFISIASHEMKTPLTTAKGYTELLLLSLSNENQSILYATKANHAIDRLQDLVTELLDVSKIQNGQLNYNVTAFDLNKMVGETIENIQHSTKNHSIQKAGSCSKQITADRNRLQQVLINLLTNAVKYSPKADKVLVKIEEKEGMIQVSVQDFGIGIPSKHLNKIFDKYYRVEEHASNFQGLGIGLYISHNIIERHNGELWVESEYEKGSTFYFTLPL